MFQRSGSGFLGSALTTAAGVAGGMVAGNALMNLFSGSHNSGYGGGSAFGASNNYSPESSHYIPVSQPDSAAASPWASTPDQYEVGGLGKESTADKDGGGWQQAAASDGGWQDAPSSSDTGSSDGGGWEDAGGSDDP